MNHAFPLAALLLTSQAVITAQTFNKDIAPLVFENCAPCHRPGEAGPFSLLTYADVAKHAQQIVTVTKSRYMPPWLPETGAVKFAEERRLSDQQIRLLEQWLAAGKPEGQAADRPATPKFTEGWQLGEPDLILKLPESYTLAADGPDVYRNFLFHFPLDSLRNVRALQVRPGNPRIVHHANLLIDRNRSSQWKDRQDGQIGFAGMDLKIETAVLDPESHFLFWKPGSVVTQEPLGMAWQIEPGTDLVLNMHMQPSGKPEAVQPSLGLYFTKEAPRLRPLLVQLENDAALKIPPGDRHFAVSDTFTLPVNVDLLGIYPHAHYLGQEVEATAQLPNGQRKQLVHIRHWDVKWQSVYRYKEPILLPKGSVISMRWVYDNSSANPANPNRPPKLVVAGDQATDEMGHAWFQLLPRGPGDQRTVIREAVMRKLLNRDPQNFTAHFNLGGLLQAKGDRDGALAELREAVRIRPHDEIALNTLGAFLQLADKPAEAEAEYREALKARPGYPDAHYNLALLLLSRDQVDEAIPHLREAVRLRREDTKARQELAEALEARGHKLARGGNVRAATPDFREIVDLKPDDSEACTNLGVALAMQGELRGAGELFERAVKLDPANKIARQNLDRVRAQLIGKQ
jgi:Flp pilus assembly protein TadD